MKITIHTSDAGSNVEDLLYHSKGGVRYDVCPELRWLHPTARLEGLVKLVEEDHDLTVLTWDELTMLVMMAAAAENVAKVEVKYWRQGETEPLDVKVDEQGSLAMWPDADGFFEQREKVLFKTGTLFRKDVQS